MTRALVVMTVLLSVVTGLSLWMRQLLTPGDVMVNYANDAVEHARERLGVRLDFSEESIPRLDGILRGASRISAGPGQDQQVKMWGAYFGEVLRRQHGGVWVDAKDGFLLETKGIRVSPGVKVRERMRGGQELMPYYESLLQAWSAVETSGGH